MADDRATRRRKQRRLLAEILAMLVLLVLVLRWNSLVLWLELPPGSAIERWGWPLVQVAALVLGTRLLLRVLNRWLWHGLVGRGDRRPVPKLLADLAAAAAWVTALVLISTFVFHLPVAGLLATSGVAIAVLGFALRDMLASLFAGMALSLDQPYRIGDWIEVEPGTVARVEQIGWLTTRAVTQSSVGIVMPNARLLAMVFRNYNHPDPSWRDGIEVTLDPSVPAATAERLLLAAMRSVPAVARAGHAPDVRIQRFEARGVVWLARFWVADYGAMVETRYQVQRALLHHLRYAGIAMPMQRNETFVHQMPDHAPDPRDHLAQLMADHELLGVLSAEDRAALAAGAVRRTCRTGLAIVREGEAGGSLFVIVEGLLEVSVRSVDGGSVHVDDLVPGTVFGEFSLLTGAARSATVTAATEAVVYEIDKALIEPLLKRQPVLAEDLSRILAERHFRTRHLADGESMLPLRDEVRASAPQLLRRVCAFFGLPDLV